MLLRIVLMIFAKLDAATIVMIADAAAAAAASCAMAQRQIQGTLGSAVCHRTRPLLTPLVLVLKQPAGESTIENAIFFSSKASGLKKKTDRQTWKKKKSASIDSHFCIGRM